VESEEISSVIWPIISDRLGEKGIEINLFLWAHTSPAGSIAKIGAPTAAPIAVDSIETDLQTNQESYHCVSLKEFTEFLCRKGKLPSSFGAVIIRYHPFGRDGSCSLDQEVPARSVREILVGRTFLLQFKLEFFKGVPETNVRAQDSKHTKMAKKTAKQLEDNFPSECNCAQAQCEALRLGPEMRITAAKYQNARKRQFTQE